MKSSLVRAFFITATLVLVIGAVMHASAFQKIQEALFVSNLTPFAADSLKVLWLADSATCLLIAVFFGSLAVMIYIFIGNFIGGHLLLAASLSAIAGTVLKG